MRDLSAPEALDEALGTLFDAGYARQLSGGRAPRYVQLLCPELHPDGGEAPPPPAAASASEPAATVQQVSSAGPQVAAAGAGPGDSRLEGLERRVLELEGTVERLVRELGA